MSKMQQQADLWRRQGNGRDEDHGGEPLLSVWAEARKL